MQALLRSFVLFISATLVFSTVQAKPITNNVPEPDSRARSAIGPFLIIIPVAVIGIWQITRRSGVTAKDIHRQLPGDSIVPGANWVVNRSAVLNAPIKEVWPWILQLGRNRAGWYEPNWIENLFNARAIRKIDTNYQHVKTGDILDDWGPGYQRVIQVTPPYVLLVDEVKKDTAKGQQRLTELGMSVSTVLEEIDSTHTKIIFRLRTKISWPSYIPARFLGGIADYTFFNTMVSGLNERLRNQQHQQNK